MLHGYRTDCCELFVTFFNPEDPADDLFADEEVLAEHLADIPKIQKASALQPRPVLMRRQLMEDGRILRRSVVSDTSVRSNEGSTRVDESIRSEVNELAV